MASRATCTRATRSPDIEKAWAASARIYDQLRFALRRKGMEMANTFLPDPVRQALWQYRDQIRAIQVISEEPLIPWELLDVTDPQAGPEGKGFLSEWGLVRWLHNAKWPTRRLALSPARVRYVIPDYVDPGLRLNGAAEERAMLKRQFADAREVKAESLAVAQFLLREAKTAICSTSLVTVRRPSGPSLTRICSWPGRKLRKELSMMHCRQTL